MCIRDRPSSFLYLTHPNNVRRDREEMNKSFFLAVVTSFSIIYLSFSLPLRFFSGHSSMSFSIVHASSRRHWCSFIIHRSMHRRHVRSRNHVGPGRWNFLCSFFFYSFSSSSLIDVGKTLRRRKSCGMKFFNPHPIRTITKRSKKSPNKCRQGEIWASERKQWNEKRTRRGQIRSARSR